MTTREAKERAKELWDEWKWWLALVVFPLVLWGARSFDASKVSTAVFANHLHDERFKRQSDSLHHADDDRMLRYLICRQDFTRRECLNPK